MNYGYTTISTPPRPPAKKKTIFLLKLKKNLQPYNQFQIQKGLAACDVWQHLITLKQHKLRVLKTCQTCSVTTTGNVLQL